MIEKKLPKFDLRKPPVLGLLVMILMIFEKFLAHTYTVMTIYVLPEPWSALGYLAQVHPSLLQLNGRAAVENEVVSISSSSSSCPS